MKGAQTFMSGQIKPIHVVFWLIIMFTTHPWTYSPGAAVVIGALAAVFLIQGVK